VKNNCQDVLFIHVVKIHPCNLIPTNEKFTIYRSIFIHVTNYMSDKIIHSINIISFIATHFYWKTPSQTFQVFIQDLAIQDLGPCVS
jgi:hypothetical protein